MNFNVGIGATSPGANLHVGDNSAAPGYASGAEDVFIEGNAEVDATVYLDGPVVMAGAMSIVNAITQTDTSGQNQFGGNIVSSGDTKWSVDTASLQWGDVYAVRLQGTLSDAVFHGTGKYKTLSHTTAKIAPFPPLCLNNKAGSRPQSESLGGKSHRRRRFS